MPDEEFVIEVPITVRRLEVGELVMKGDYYYKNEKWQLSPRWDFLVSSKWKVKMQFARRVLQYE